MEFGPADTAAEQLERWDAGEIIWTLEMGGLGPGYEQAIQILAIEIVRDEIGKELPPPSTPLHGWADATAARIDRKLPDGRYSCGGFSGAQVGAAKWLAYQWLHIGPAALLEKTFDKMRSIRVDRFWPRAYVEAKA